MQSNITDFLNELQLPQKYQMLRKKNFLQELRADDLKLNCVTQRNFS